MSLSFTSSETALFLKFQKSNEEDVKILYIVLGCNTKLVVIVQLRLSTNAVNLKHCRNLCRSRIASLDVSTELELPPLG